MWRQTRVDFVAPPFAGHLFPILELATGLKGMGMPHVRVLSDASVADTVHACGLIHADLLPGKSHLIKAVADTGHRIGSNPVRLHGQFKATLALLGEAQANLRNIWMRERPGVVIADFTVPVAGFLAQAMGIPWWTSMPSPCVIESPEGIPGYVGGWSPREGFLGSARDWAGRGVVRAFKRSLSTLAGGRLKSLGFETLYRSDGTEAVYSDQRIFALGLKEFEFPKRWPRAVEFIGPVTGCPTLPHAPVVFKAGRRSVLVTLGTHLPWARARALELMSRVAKLMGECDFHFAGGKAGCIGARSEGNFHQYDFVPYDAYLHQYQAVIHHGGTGVTYACIKAGVSALVWPHDYDQADHAARLVHHGLALRLRPTPERVAADLRGLLARGQVSPAAERFKALAKGADPVGCVARAIEEL